MKLSVLDLPQDVLEIVFLYLGPRSFLHFCCITKQFRQDQCRNPTYWRVITSTTFRIPISPLLHAEGDRWYWLYKKLRTQTKAFAWGQGLHSALGLPPIPRTLTQAQGPPANARMTRPLVRRVIPLLRQQQDRPQPPAGHILMKDHSNHSFPSRMDVPAAVGVIADLQCGGWSTTLLSSQGDLYSVGILDQDVGVNSDNLKRLDYRSRAPIKSFSAGRRHVLGLDEEGHVWSWDRITAPASQIYNVTAMKAFKVVAGWSVSSAYTKEGILYWHVSNPFGPQGTGLVRIPRGSEGLDEPQDEVELRKGPQIFVETTVVPATNFRSQQPQSNAVDTVGEVLAYIVLEAYIVFITDLAKVFACRIADEDEPEGLPFEVSSFSAPERRLKDIQGSFRKFSVFTAKGEVLSGDQEYLDHLYRLRRAAQSEHQFILPLEQGASDVRRPADIPALQHAGVVSIGYGDYHFHALHSDGRITSYGHEPKCCGALGLGATNAGARFRGVRVGDGNIWNREAKMLPIGYKHGREIWFSASQEAWLNRLEVLIRTPEASLDHHPAFALLNEQQDKQAAYSEWVEREGRAWEEGVDDEDGLRSYFAISVAAAGWHSAALVLENSEMVDKVTKKWQDQEGKYVWESVGFPRICLPDGFEFPGSGELRGWRGGMPSAAELDAAEQDTSSS